MKVVIDHARAMSRHPEAAAKLIADMERKLKRAKQPIPDKDAYEWGYDWATRIAAVPLADILGLGGSGSTEKDVSDDPLDNCYPSLELVHGKRQSFHPFFTPGPSAEPMPREELPPEIVSSYAPPGGKDTVDPVTYPHIAAFEVSNPHKGGTHTELATSGYRSSTGTYIHHVCPGDEMMDGQAFEILYRIEGDTVVWSGSLVPKARERFDATPEGQEFRYRNKAFTRLTTQEIKTLVSGKTFDLVFP